MPTGIAKSGKRKCAPRTPGVVITCEECGGLRRFMAYEIARRGLVRFCSQACRKLSTSRRSVECIECPVCHKAVVKRRARNARYCSRECGGRAQRVEGAKWKDPAQIKQYMVAYLAKNRVRLNAERYKWKRNNRDKVNAAQRKRRKGRPACGLFRGPEWIAFKATFDFTCQHCRAIEPTVRLEADHIVPIARGGSNDISNIQPLCRTCNSRKGARLESELVEHGITIRETGARAPLRGHRKTKPRSTN